jgi:hypothetical protein
MLEDDHSAEAAIITTAASPHTIVSVRAHAAAAPPPLHAPPSAASANGHSTRARPALAHAPRRCERRSERRLLEPSSPEPQSSPQC